MYVEEVDYKSLVREMGEAGIDRMGEVLVGKLKEVGTPGMKNEVLYFWTSLFNEAKFHETVWLWLCTAPNIRQYAPSNAALYADNPHLTPDMPLPVIEGEDDEKLPRREKPKQWPEEPTLENFIEQATALDKFFREETEKEPRTPCKTIEECVATFYSSEVRQADAQIQLTELGFHALATKEGIDFLIKTYPPP